MTYRLIQTYADGGDEVEIGGRAYPAPALIEDEDGIRLLLLPYPDLPVAEATWASARRQGAQALVSATPLAYVLAEAFAEHQGELSGHFVLPARLWTTTDTPPRYAEMVLQHEQEPSLPAVTSFVHVHTHTEFSPLDGLSKLEELATIAVEQGMQALAVTDHGQCAGHPDLQKVATKYGLRPIFGIEAYFVDDRHNRDGKPHDYWHLVLWAMDDEGLRNLWAMSTESYQDGLHGKYPRMDWSTLERFNEGVMASTACLGGPLMKPWQADNEELATRNLMRLKSIFDGRLYIELHVNQMDKQIAANKWLVELAGRYEVPLVAAADSHYPAKAQRQTHQDWLSVQLERDVSETNLFEGGHDYHLMSEGEVRKSLSYLPDSVVDEAILNTAVIANRCTAEIRPVLRNPIYSRVSEEYPDRVQHDVDRLLEVCLGRWEERTVGKPHAQSVYMERFEREMNLLISKGFCGYFLIVWDLVAYAKRTGILVGPGRGSGGGSLVAYLSGITEIDPVENDLLFERFMTEGRTELPDFDIDFPSSKKAQMFVYAAQRWGADNVATVGTHMRLKNKSAIRGTMQALRDRLPDSIFMDQKPISKIVDEAEAHTAGLGLSWDELWAQAGDLLEPYREKYPAVFELAGLFHGRLRGYGKHPAGIIIDTDHPLTGALPLRKGEDDVGMVAQFDLDALAELGYVKFDLLNISNLDTIQACVDLIEEQTGFRVVPYGWRDEYSDPIIYDEIGAGWTLGIFQIGTNSGTRAVKQFKPRTIAELADVITLVRPGPKNSGLDKIYYRRKIGEEETSYADPRLEGILSKTFGTMLYQEDIMAVCMTLAGYDSNEADKVRKILGKKKVELVQEAGEKFIRRAIENHTNPSIAASMWDQMAEFAKYSFNRAHACAYAIVGFWTAWLKFHYPVQFLCAALSTVDSDRIPDFVSEARRMGYHVQPPDINRSGAGFTAHGMNVLYGLRAVHGVGEVAANTILATRPYTGWEDFLEKKTGKCNAGHAKALVRVGAFDSLFPNRRALESRIEFDALPPTDKCRFKDPATVNDFGLPCTFDWVNEPVEIGRSGKAKKAKPPPKKCTKACRQYSPHPPPDPESIEPYTDGDIRDIEMELLGVHLSSTPFDRISSEDKESLSTAIDVLAGPNGSYTIAAIIRSKRGYVPASGKVMGFLTVTTERGDLDITVFNNWWEGYNQQFAIGALCLIAVTKNDRGHSLDGFMNVDE